MDRLQQIKESFNRGRMSICDIKYLISRIEADRSEIKDYQETLIKARKEIKELKTQLVNA